MTRRRALRSSRGLQAQPMRDHVTRDLAQRTAINEGVRAQAHECLVQPHAELHRHDPVA